MHCIACIASGMEIAAFRFVILGTRTRLCHHRRTHWPWYARWLPGAIDCVTINIKPWRALAGLGGLAVLIGEENFYGGPG